ncbi:acetyl-CoA carboxylase biotin carboxyl carrier protein [Francisella philomiragia]|uniref:Biotin carboxyl carrier protein of acetyl-CoA carboxylase n=1 Tax=Francisella philomiragia subsp. philomiragia (strain ATCC 25017 / CCUG 19701 / FSC 153 / O\|nr:acetyl-CoA carboxylase biotin carboxyl carrier protein [Francisella philomiragia]AJI46742.1 acetyl-CoA carboxylase, biotin carboxyl carrier protein [Francisella philomiragia]AJI49223.1 acetyl-CoA carboxylase, biotin carboxyl carrier protein [Francisella philomiragia]MBK2020128.1 acetyl-CoA carboxylase biotin carboxyl carrier protein [Francisella philomiragia]MBK2029590.1 acetyl-CoA carboxylase biotin carboxyl carrier protein [Francisella philomiragia]MBK2263386.1 acetyl-CoA carboxylase biot
MDLLKAIDRVAEILNSSDIKEIRVKDGGSSIFMTKNNTAATVVSAAPAVSNVTSAAPVAASTPSAALAPKQAEVSSEISGEEIKSPMVGTFYGASSPDAAPYVKEGQEVKKGDILCIIEAMKIMNKIEAEKAGKIVKIIAKDGDPVQFDQPLFIIE